MKNIYILILQTIAISVVQTAFTYHYDHNTKWTELFIFFSAEFPVNISIKYFIEKYVQEKTKNSYNWIKISEKNLLIGIIVGCNMVIVLPIMSTDIRENYLTSPTPAYILVSSICVFWLINMLKFYYKSTKEHKKTTQMT